MHKELIISIIIIICILSLNAITQKYTKESVSTMKEDLSILREEMRQENLNKNKIDMAIEKASNNWESRHDKLAYYIEHDELEKVETHLTILKSNIEVGDFEQGIGELDSCTFVLEHIQDKESFKVKNIF